MLVPHASCATLFNGSTQLVPVTSRPERAEVFVDGVSAGFAPVQLTLRRDAEYAVYVRLGDRVRSLALKREMQGAVVGLDLVPVGLTGGLVVLASGLGSTSDVVYAVALLGVSMAPGLVDYGTGAQFRLHPSEIVAVFD